MEDTAILPMEGLIIGFTLEGVGYSVGESRKQVVED